ncbi:hypothetical protein RR46_11653 [Papilio xuthus]|uniref:Uncharacterized protein n=1 Tax=Papilio xuthus TaxID=66420 RepID=A0A194PXR4_PAPXU|nr:hypothetical protein RR46_11653 [Papilio xuthus]
MCYTISGYRQMLYDGSFGLLLYLLDGCHSVGPSRTTNNCETIQWSDKVNRHTILVRTSHDLKGRELKDTARVRGQTTPEGRGPRASSMPILNNDLSFKLAPHMNRTIVALVVV